MVDLELLSKEAKTVHATDKSSMKALVYRGPGEKALEDRPIPEITAATDAAVRITRTTICGTDLHILKGDVPTCSAGRILGHEGVGVIEKVGGAVTSFHVGDHVIISCISSCGKCEYCRRGMYSHCVQGGWIATRSMVHKPSTFASRLLRLASTIFRLGRMKTLLSC